MRGSAVGKHFDKAVTKHVCAKALDQAVHEGWLIEDVNYVRARPNQETPIHCQSQMCSAMSAWLASAWPAAAARSLLSRSVLPRVSPTLAAAEGHQKVGPSHPSWRVG